MQTVDSTFYDCSRAFRAISDNFGKLPWSRSVLRFYSFLGHKTGSHTSVLLWPQHSLDTNCLCGTGRDRPLTLQPLHSLPFSLPLLSLVPHLQKPSFCLFSHTAAAAALLQSFPTLCDPIDGSPAGSPVPGILQARRLEWVAISFSNA